VIDDPAAARLRQLQLMFTAVVGGLVMFGVLLPLLELAPKGDALPFVIAVVLVAVVAAAARSIAFRRVAVDVTGSSEQVAGRIAGAFATRMFLGIALGEAPGIAGFAMAILTGRPWVYLVGAALALPLLAAAAPTDSAVARFDRELQLTGSAMTTREALAAASQPPAAGVPPA
jgi:Na+/melibiose symporter-like transporter